ncbi:MAG: DUF177 domain-containing protein [Actinobacteria bacterium]|nr:DUF177 domain-containing protein [Actinomycetota bacterium]MDI6831297.1 YceD family protein [Actinomycetota bacterium]
MTGETPFDRRLKVPVTNLQKKVFSREKVSVSLDARVGDEGVVYLGEQGDLRLEAWMESSPDGIRVKGRIEGSISVHCTRCLEEYRHRLDLAVDEFYRRPGLGAVGPEGRRLRDAEVLEDDDYVIHEGAVDLNLLVNDNVMTGLPIKRLCDEACRGLCPRCGKNLNQGDCRCEAEETDPRLEVLRGLLEEEGWE